MHVDSNTIKNDIRKTIADMKTLRDEIRVRLHLGGMEAKERWAELEKHLASLEGDAEEVTEHAGAKLREFIVKLKAFSATLRQPPPNA